MAGPQIRVTVNSSGGRSRIPKGNPGAGRFMTGGDPEMRRQLRDFNRKMARELQADVLENMAGNIMRRNVSSGRLLQATANRDNIEFSEFHVGVGIPAYLDKSIAKYWRTIEEGSKVVWADVGSGRSSIIGMELRGFWGANKGRVTPDRVYANKPWFRHSPRRSDLFVPAGKFRAQDPKSGSFRYAKFNGGTGGKSGPPNFVKTTTVKNEIDPHHDYADANARYQPGRRAFDEVNQIIGTALRAAKWLEQ